MLAHRGTRGSLFVYELVYDGGGDGRPALAGLTDVKMLTSKSDAAPQMDNKSEKFDPLTAKFDPLKPEFDPTSTPLRTGFEQGVAPSKIKNSSESPDKKAEIGAEKPLEGSQIQQLSLSKSGGAKRGGSRS
ncbi:MAG: hypothetical protein HY074_07325 [Deltaproteobacteria bacterium]|nr:hypothetical protein [Deltaproteobacteria bacterium]